MPVRAKTIAWWATPPLLGLLLYWRGLTCWFQNDDLNWLNLRNLVHNWHDLWWALFTPFGQGTIRPLSERAFYMSFYSMFGTNQVPYRCLAFLTYTVTLVLLASVCRRLTGSRAAGFWAMIFWTVNCAMADALSWTAIYYELLCAFFLLLAFWFLLRYAETGKRRYYIAQCVTFVAGFLVLELNVVYPALAAMYALCCAPRLLRKVLPLFAISAAYAAVHIAVAHLPSSGPYKMHWDASVFTTLWTYWEWAVGPDRLILLHIEPSWRSVALEVGLTAGLLGFLAWMLWRRRWVAAFFPAWFLIVLAPVLPLRDHISEYYLTIPLIGLAMWGGWALVSGWRAGWAGRIATIVLLVIYLGVSVPIAREQARGLAASADETRRVVMGVAGLSRGRPEKIVLLNGVSPAIFGAVIRHHPFRMVGIPQVYVLSEDVPGLAGVLPLGDSSYTIDPALERKAVLQDQAVVYRLGSEVQDITAEYKASLLSRPGEDLAALVDVGNPLVSGQVGPEWYANESGHRWMPRRATVTLRGPGEELAVKGYCPAAALKAGPLRMQIVVDGEKLAPVSIVKPDAPFSFVFKLPLHRGKVEISVELDRSFKIASDPRELGLVFGSFEIR
jgi:hypothetical protein